MKPSINRRAERFANDPGGVLQVTDPNLDEQIRRLSLRAMDLGATAKQMEAALRCLINHCEAQIAGLANRKGTS